jgi:hypothetical protein
MEPEILKKLGEQDMKLEEIYKISKQTRNYFRLTLIVSVVVIIFPLIGLLFVAPSFISSFSSQLPPELLKSGGL